MHNLYRVDELGGKKYGKIAIDAGHGLKTAGKRCLKSLDKNETREWVLNNRVSVALEDYLESAGHTVLRVVDRDGSTDVTLAVP